MLPAIMEETLRIIVLADDPLVRAGLAALAAALPGCAVVVQGSGELLFEAAAGLLEVPADLIIWDAGWGADEKESEERLDGVMPILALVTDEEGAAAVWRLGARSVALRDMDEGRLAAAVMGAAAGLVVLAPSLVAALTRGETAADAVSGIDLTPRELEVLALLAEGLTNKAIAHQLTISDHTVKFHVNAILNKLDAQSRTDAVVRATRLGLISL
jgi:DNA-binding NarL/FixJ family response regulator